MHSQNYWTDDTFIMKPLDYLKRKTSEYILFLTWRVCDVALLEHVLSVPWATELHDYE